MTYPICINCQDFSYLDGDFCCVGQSANRILLYGAEMNEDSLSKLPTECSMYKPCNDKRLVQLRKEVIGDIIGENSKQS